METSSKTKRRTRKRRRRSQVATSDNLTIRISMPPEGEALNPMDKAMWIGDWTSKRIFSFEEDDPRQSGRTDSTSLRTQEIIGLLDNNNKQNWRSSLQDWRRAKLTVAAKDQTDQSHLEAAKFVNTWLKTLAADLQQDIAKPRGVIRK